MGGPLPHFKIDYVITRTKNVGIDPNLFQVTIKAIGGEVKNMLSSYERAFQYEVNAFSGWPPSLEVKIQGQFKDISRIFQPFLPIFKDFLTQNSRISRTQRKYPN